MTIQELGPAIEMPPVPRPHARERLRQLLAEKAFVTSADGRELRDRSGASVPWLYYGGEVILSAEGASLMASVVLERLVTFEATQIATCGVSAIPLLATCVAFGSGRYSGLVVRKELKRHGVARRIDGPVDRSRPVVVVDDTISSGTTLYETFCALEAEGLRVEGAVCLIEFSGYGAREWLTARGYRLETVYDVWRDLGRSGARVAPQRPAFAPWSADQVPAGLSPAMVARHVGEHLLRTGTLPLPPISLDRPVDASGGTFVSIRRRSDDVRLVRAGSRRDGDGDEVDPRLDLVLAAGEALHVAGLRTPDALDGVKFAVSFLAEPRAIVPGEIDHREHALVIRGVGPLDRIGFALPNAPHYDDEIEQYGYARFVSARFGPLEPHTLRRQSITRVIEPGATWPPYGAPPVDPDWTRSPDFERAIAQQIRSILRERFYDSSDDAPAPTPQSGGPVFAVGVSLYADGLVGCAMSLATDLTAALREATAVALADRRYGSRLQSLRHEDLTVVVSLLLHRRRLGRLDPGRLQLFYRLGRDTLQVTGKGREGTVLAHFAAQQSIGKAAYQEQVLRKAGLAQYDADWTAYETASWVVDHDGCWRMDLGYPERPNSAQVHGEQLVRLAESMAVYILGQRQADGLPAYQCYPWTGTVSTTGTATRVLIALTGLLEAGAVLGGEVRAAACSMVELFVRGDDVRVPRAGLRWDSAADAQLLTCLCLADMLDKHRGAALRLVRRLRELFRDDGAIHSSGVRMSADLDLLSGSVLLALAHADAWLSEALADIDLATILAFYRKRFHLSSPWGMVWWHGQAWNELASRDAGFGRFAFDLVDWALDRQSATSGAFVIDTMEPQRSSFLTACVLEAIAGAWSRARSTGDHERAARYEDACRRGMAFVQRLTLREGDMYFSGQGAGYAGGVRAILPSSELRIDYAGHALIALAKGIRAGGV